MMTGWKKWAIPLAVLVIVVGIVIAVFAIPKNGDEENAPAISTPYESTTRLETGGTQTAVLASRDEVGNIALSAADLSSDTVTFLRIAQDRKVELLARAGDDGGVEVALGTCQSCNGSPDAYYTQVDDMLQCAKCGMTLPLSAIGEPSEGCHPIAITPDAIQQTDDGVTIDIQTLLGYENLFETVADH